MSSKGFPVNNQDSNMIFDQLPDLPEDFRDIYEEAKDLYNKYYRSRELNELLGAIDLLTSLAQKLSEKSPVFAQIHNNIGVLHTGIFEINGEMDELNRAIYHLEIAVGLSEEVEVKETWQISFLKNLGNCLRYRYIENKSIVDISRSIYLLRSALGKSKKIGYDIANIRHHLDKSIELHPIYSKLDSIGQNIQLVISNNSQFQEEEILSVNILESKILPYISSIHDLQLIIKELKKDTDNQFQIRSIYKLSPIGVSLEGSADAIKTIRDEVTPWRRKHAQEMATLEKQEKEVMLEQARAEVLARRAQADRERAEAQLRREEAEKLRIENQQARQKLDLQLVELSFRIIDRYAPNLSDDERMFCLIRLLPAVKSLSYGNVDINPET